MPHTKRTSITLTTKQHAALDAEAERVGVTLAELIRRILDEWRGRRGL